MKSLSDLINKNRDFIAWTEEIIKEKKRRYAELTIFNSEIDLDEFKNLDYSEMKVIWDDLHSNFEDTLKDKLKIIIKEAEIKKYPILTKAHYYPIINELDFLTDAQKNKLDSTLLKFKNSFVATGCSAWSDLNFSRELTDEILEALEEKGMLEKHLQLSCVCGDEKRNISPNEYFKFSRFYAIESILGKGDRAILDEYNELWDMLNFESSCFECEGREITSMKVIDDYSRVIYKNVAIPILTCEQ